MAKERIPYRTSMSVELIRPTDVIAAPPNPLDASGDSSSCSFKVYDPGKDEVLSTAEAAAQTELSVTNAGVFEVGDLVEVDLDDGTIHDAGAITAVDPTAGTIDVTTGLASGAAAGKRVRVRLGTQITMTEFGTPEVGSLDDWGFRGPLASDHPGLDIDQDVDIEITFVGAPGGGLDLLEVICGVIKPEADCRDCD